MTEHTECILSCFLHGSILCFGIYMSVIKPWICFSNGFFQLSGGTSCLFNACCLRLLVFLETWVVAPFWHWRSLVFPKGCCHYDLKAFCISGHNNLVKNIIENMKWRWIVYYLSLLFTYLYERALNHKMVKLKIFGELSLNFSFGKRSYLISDFT